MKRTKIFVYNGFLGIESGFDVDGLIADPQSQPGSLGFVIKTDCIEITTEAKDAFKRAKRDGGSFATTMLTEHDPSIVDKHGKSSFGFLGGPLFMQKVSELEIGRTCTLSSLDDMILNDAMEIPDGFKVAVDKENS